MIMLLLKDNPIVQNVKANYVRIEELIREMKEKKLTGYIEVIIKDSRDILLYDSGKIVKILKINKGISVIDKDSVVFDLVKSDAVFSVYKMDGNVIEIILASIENKPLYATLTTEFIDLRKLMKKLYKEELSGVIYLSWNGGEGGILVDSGIPSYAVSLESNIISDGAEALEEIVRKSERRAATVDIFTNEKRSE
jgi:hypothetical protein